MEPKRKPGRPKKEPAQFAPEQFDEQDETFNTGPIAEPEGTDEPTIREVLGEITPPPVPSRLPKFLNDPNDPGDAYAPLQRVLVHNGVQVGTEIKQTWDRTINKLDLRLFGNVGVTIQREGKEKYLIPFSNIIWCMF